MRVAQIMLAKRFGGAERAPERSGGGKRETGAEHAAPGQARPGDTGECRTAVDLSEPPLHRRAPEGRSSQSGEVS